MSNKQYVIKSISGYYTDKAPHWTNNIRLAVHFEHTKDALIIAQDIKTAKVVRVKKKISKEKQMILDIKEILWPDGSTDCEWNYTTASDISFILSDNGYNPND